MDNQPLPNCELIDICPVCDSPNIEYWTNAKDLQTQSSDQLFTYSKCLDCKCRFISKRVVEEDISFFYSSNYEPYQPSLNIPIRSPVLSFFVLLAKPVTKCLKYISAYLHSIDRLTKKVSSVYEKLDSGKLFVDFGCGAGKYLNRMRGSGCVTVGVDFSPIAVKTVKENNHAAYLVPEFFAEYQNASVDLMRMNHVVEHLYQPDKTLAAIASKLKSGADLHIAVPNPAGISARVFRNNWWGLDCPRHIILYPPVTLQRLLTKHGFHNFEVFQESISKDFIRSIGYFLASRDIMKLSSINSLMYSRFLNLIFWMPLKIASLMGFGDRYHIFCNKK